MPLGPPPSVAVISLRHPPFQGASPMVIPWKRLGGRVRDAILNFLEYLKEAE
jgi:hypothetical protein